MYNVSNNTVQNSLFVHVDGNNMKLIKHFIWYFFADLALAKKAGVLARQGRSKEAAELMSNTKII